MYLLVVHIIVLKGREGQWPVGRQRALHNGGVGRHGTLGVEMHDLDLYRLVARVGGGRGV